MPGGPVIAVLVVTNMFPAEEDPGRGIFVRDQVAELRRRPGLDIELFAFRSLGAGAYARAARQIASRCRRRRFDVVHSHFGLTIWPALAARARARVATLHGTDLVHPRSRAITLAGLPLVDVVAPVSEALAQLVPRVAVRGELAVLPTGVNLERFRVIARREARRALGLQEDGPYVLFPADPARAEKRFDRARAVAGDVPLLALEGVDPDEVPLWINAANAVVVPSERESFGLAVLEALACDVPVLATPVGIAPEALAGVDGTLCGPFDAGVWRKALALALAQEDPRVPGRAAAERYSSASAAAQVHAVYRRLAGV